MSGTSDACVIPASVWEKNNQISTLLVEVSLFTLIIILFTRLINGACWRILIKLSRKLCACLLLPSCKFILTFELWIWLKIVLPCFHYRFPFVWVSVGTRTIQIPTSFVTASKPTFSNFPMIWRLHFYYFTTPAQEKWMKNAVWLYGINNSTCF